MIKPLAKSVLIPLGLTASASAADAGIHKKILGSGNNNNTTTLKISNNEIEDIIKVVKSLENSGLLLKGVTETVQNEIKEQKGGFLVISYITCKFIRKYLSGQMNKIEEKSRGINRTGEGIVRAGYGSGSSKMDF